MVRIQATLTGLLLVWAALGLVAPEARAITPIDRSLLYEYNDCSSSPCSPTSIQTTPADEVTVLPLQGIPSLLKLDDSGFPTILNDPNSDYFLNLDAVLDPYGTFKPNKKIKPKNPLVATITFEVGWYGTVQGVPYQPGEEATNPEFLFLLTAIREGLTGPIDPAIDSSYFRNSSMNLDGFHTLEQLYSDCLVSDGPSCGQSFVDDRNSGFNTERYLGFLGELRAPNGGTPGNYQVSDLNFISFKLDWILQQEPLTPDGNFLLVNSGYINPNVPEPGVIALLGVGALVFARHRRRRA